MVGADLASSRLESAIAITVHLRYDATPAKISHTEEYEAIIFPIGAAVDPANVLSVNHDPRNFLDDPPRPDASFALTQAKTHTKAFWKSVESRMKAHLVATRTVTIYRNASLKAYSRGGETEGEFMVRCTAQAEDAADAAMAKLEQRYKTRIDRVRASLSKAEIRVRELDAQAAA